MFQLVDGESIRAWGGGVLAGVDGRTHLCGRERRYVGIQPVFTTDAPEGTPGTSIWDVLHGFCEHPGKARCDPPVIRENTAFEGDWLVRVMAFPGS